MATPEPGNDLGVAEPELEYERTPVSVAVALVLFQPRQAGMAAAVLAHLLRPPTAPA
jgi:hypothetical protein